MQFFSFDYFKAYRAINMENRDYFIKHVSPGMCYGNSAFHCSLRDNFWSWNLILCINHRLKYFKCCLAIKQNSMDSVNIKASRRWSTIKAAVRDALEEIVADLFFLSEKCFLTLHERKKDHWTWSLCVACNLLTSDRSIYLLKRSIS